MKEQELPIVRDPESLEQLYRVPNEPSVERELFPVMAVLLAHVLFVDGKFREKST